MTIESTGGSGQKRISLTPEQMEQQAELKKNILEKELYLDTKGKPTCFIPAKKTSRRLPGKNKMPFDGVPMVVRAIKTVQESGIFGNIFVSSDDEEILEMAYEAGASPHKRPSALATDKTQLKYVINHLLRVYANVPEWFGVVIPPVPLRTPQDLIGAWNTLTGGWAAQKDVNKKPYYVMSVVPFSPPPQSALKIKGGHLELLSEEGGKQSQKMQKLYRHDGTIIMGYTRVFIQEVEKGFYGTNVIPYIIEHPSVDVDTKEDYDLATYYYQRRKNEVAVEKPNT